MVNRTQDYGLKDLQTHKIFFDIVIVLKAFLSTISFIIQFFIKERFCKHHFLYSVEHSKVIGQDN